MTFCFLYNLFPKFSLWAVVLILVGWGGFSATGAEAREWEPLFDGETLQGWQVYGDGQWRVADGAIVCENGSSREFSWLVSDVTADNFVFHARFKWIRGNSGVQFRSRFEQDNLVGYQADLDLSNAFTTGALHEQGGRRRLINPPPWLIRTLDPDAWQDLEIVAAGDHIRIFLNGVVSAATRDAVAAEGFFALQVHDGDGCEVLWKDLRLFRLEPGEDFVNLLDGEQLNGGLVQHGEGTWSVKEGDHVKAESAQGQHGAMLTSGIVGDFVFSTRYRWGGGDGGFCFGVQDGKSVGNGYQLFTMPDQEGRHGQLFHQGRPVAQQSLVDQASSSEKLRPTNGWHQFEVTCSEGKLTAYHDGVMLTEYVFPPEANCHGLLGLFLAPEGESRFLWKDARLMRLLNLVE